jgi:hypothetical protein
VEEDGAVAAVVVAVIDCSRRSAVEGSSEALSWPLAIDLAGGSMVMRTRRDVLSLLPLFFPRGFAVSKSRKVLGVLRVLVKKILRSPYEKGR